MPVWLKNRETTDAGWPLTERRVPEPDVWPGAVSVPAEPGAPVLDAVAPGVPCPPAVVDTPGRVVVEEPELVEVVDEGRREVVVRGDLVVDDEDAEGSTVLDPVGDVVVGAALVVVSAEDAGGVAWVVLVVEVLVELEVLGMLDVLDSPSVVVVLSVGVEIGGSFVVGDWPVVVVVVDGAALAAAATGRDTMAGATHAAPPATTDARQARRRNSRRSRSSDSSVTKGSQPHTLSGIHGRGHHGRRHGGRAVCWDSHVLRPAKCDPVPR